MPSALFYFIYLFIFFLTFLLIFYFHYHYNFDLRCLIDVKYKLILKRYHNFIHGTMLRIVNIEVRGKVRKFAMIERNLHLMIFFRNYRLTHTGKKKKIYYHPVEVSSPVNTVANLENALLLYRGANYTEAKPVSSKQSICVSGVPP